MTLEEFGTIYEELGPTTTTFLALRFQDEDVAQDAVQQAAVFMRERLDRLTQITPSYFKQIAYGYAMHIITTNPRHASARRLHEVNVGTWFDLARVDDPTTIYDGTDPDTSVCMGGENDA